MKDETTLKILIAYSLVALIIGLLVSCEDFIQVRDVVEPIKPDTPTETMVSAAKVAPDAGVGRIIPEYEVVEVTATAYCPCEMCCGKSDRITATGTVAKEGRTIAVDPAIIPYGTEVEINGVTYIAEDCGGAIDGYDIDIFFDSHEEALEFGIQELTAYIK